MAKRIRNVADNKSHTCDTIIYASIDIDTLLTNAICSPCLFFVALQVGNGVDECFCRMLSFSVVDDVSIVGLRNLCISFPVI